MTNILAKKAVLATLQISSWGVRRVDHDATDEVLNKHQANGDAGMFTKRLLAKDAVADIKRAKWAARSYHMSRTQPWLQAGTRLLPTSLYLEYAKEMQKHKEEFERVVRELIKDYPKHVKAAERELGSLFNAEDYPTATTLASTYSMDIMIDPVPDKGSFMPGLTIDVADLAEIKTDLEKRMKSQLEAALKDVAERMAEAVGHMVGKLKEYKPANHKKGMKASNTFRDSLVENIRELTDLIPSFNLSNDATLDKLHKRLLKEICPIDPNALREDSNVRAKVAKSAQDILDEIQQFMK